MGAVMSRNRLWQYEIAYAPMEVMDLIDSKLFFTKNPIVPPAYLKGGGRNPSETFILLWANKSKAERLAGHLTHELGVDPKYVNLASFEDTEVVLAKWDGAPTLTIAVDAGMPELRWKATGFAAEPDVWVITPLNWFEVFEIVRDRLPAIMVLNFIVELGQRAERVLWISSTPSYDDDPDRITLVLPQENLAELIADEINYKVEEAENPAG
jgi:hypothetical protein